MIASRMGRLHAASVTRSDISTDISSAMIARTAKTMASRMSAEESGNRPREEDRVRDSEPGAQRQAHSENAVVTLSYRHGTSRGLQCPVYRHR